MKDVKVMATADAVADEKTQNKAKWIRRAIHHIASLKEEADKNSQVGVE